MSDYLSKYQGAEIDERLERVDYLIPKSVIVNDFANDETDHVASASLSHQLKVLVDELFNRFVTNDTNQTIEGEKAFSDAALFSSGLTVPSGQTITITTDPVSIRGAVAKEYMDKRAVDTNVAGRGLKFIAGVGSAPNSVEIELDTASGLKFNDATVAAKLRVDINGTSEAGFANPSDELMMWSVSGNALRKIKKSALLGDLTKSLRIRGSWDPTANTVSGDAINASLTKGSSPITSDGDSPQGYQYYVSADGTFDLIDDNTPEQFRIGDSVVWTGTAWILLRDQSKVVSFTGAQGTSRQGLVTAASGDYSADMVTYTRASGKTDIQASSATVHLALNDLDDQKVGRNSPSFYGTTTLPNGTTADLALTFAGSPTSGVFYDGSGVTFTSSGVDIYSVLGNGLQTRPNMRYSVNGKGYLTDVNEAGVFSTMLASLTQLRLRGSVVKLIGLDNVDLLSATSSSMTMKVSGIDTLSLSTTAVTLSKPLVLPVGTVATPTLTFAGSPTSGIWNNAGAMSISVGGVEVTRFVDAGLLMKKPLLMGTENADAQQISWVANGTSPNDAVNLSQLTAAVNATYRADSSLTAISVSTAAAVFDITAVNGAKYLVYSKAGGSEGRQISEFLVTHDGLNIYVSEYGQVGADLMTVSFVLSGNNCIMNVAPVTGTIDVKVKTIALM